MHLRPRRREGCTLNIDGNALLSQADDGSSLPKVMEISLPDDDEGRGRAKVAFEEAQGATVPSATAAAGAPASTISTKSKKTLQEVLVIAGRRALGGGIPGAIAGALQVICLMWLRTITNYQYRYNVRSRFL